MARHYETVNIGIDTSKTHLDVHIQETQQCVRFANNEKDIHRLVKGFSVPKIIKQPRHLPTPKNKNPVTN